MRTTLFAALAIFSLSTIACGPEEALEYADEVQELKGGKGANDTGSTGPTTTSTRTTTTKKKGGKKSTTITPELVIPTPEPASTYGLRFTNAWVPGEEPVWTSEFAVTDTYFVEIATELPAEATGHHTLQVYVREPSAGGVYQRFDVAFAAGVSPNEGEVNAETTATGYRVWVSLPVKGTFIDSYSLLGTWSVESWIDSGSTANATGSFGLR